MLLVDGCNFTLNDRNRICQQSNVQNVGELRQNLFTNYVRVYVRKRNYISQTGCTNMLELNSEH
jgi:hypothetical protein